MTKKKRIIEHDNHKSMEQKSSKKFSKLCDVYDKFLVDNIVKEKLYKESPHTVISKHFHLIKKNQ